MTMGINIKNAEAERLIREFAAKIGKGQTEAVTRAVREALDRLPTESGEERLKRMTEIADKMAPLFKRPYDTIDHADLLYDEKTGLPK